MIERSRSNVADLNTSAGRVSLLIHVIHPRLLSIAFPYSADRIIIADRAVSSECFK